MIHKFKIEKTAFFAQIGELNSNTKHIWYCLHGYGQLAKAFIHECNVLLEDDSCVIAPEAPSKFYLKGLEGDVGATWMTAEERGSDVEDYIIYLNSLSKHIHSKAGLSCKTHVLGFSQGAATASQWVNSGGITPDSLCLWSGAFAMDLKLDYHTRLSKMELLTVCGTSDKIYTMTMMEKQIRTLKEKGFDVESIYHPGKHNLEEATLMKVRDIVTNP